MARKPQVRYFESRQAFYTQFRGRQHKLADGPDDSQHQGPNYLAALVAYGHLLRLGNVEIAKDRNTVRVIVEKYLQHQEGRLKESTFTRRLYLLRPFCDAVGEVAVGDLTHLRVNEFLDAMRRPRQVRNRTYAWRGASVASFIEAVTACFNWAVKSKLVTANPLAGIDRPNKRSRSRDLILTPEVHQRVLAECHAKTFRNICVALENTGARPGELIAATAADWNDELGALVYYGDDRRQQDEFRHKTAGKGRDRVINFDGEALEMVRQLVKDHPSGPIFRTSRGEGYSEKSVCSCFRAIRDRLQLPRLTAYSYRHTFATRWLLSGGSIEVLAELLGNTPAIIRKHYAHLCSDRAGIRRHLENFRTAAGRDEKPSSAPSADGPRLHRA